MGENFEVRKENGDFDNLGFYTTRVVKAANEKDAELAAVELIKNDMALTNCLNKESERKPMIYLESISKLPIWSKLGGSGYGFFPMEESK